MPYMTTIMIDGSWHVALITVIIGVTEVVNRLVSQVTVTLLKIGYSLVLSQCMMTSSSGNFFRVTGHFAGNSPVPVNSPHKGQWRGALVFSLICVWIYGSVNNREAGDCPACRTTLIATRFWVVMICPIIKCLTVLRGFFYFVWFVFIHHNFQFYFELCTYCNILDFYLS